MNAITVLISAILFAFILITTSALVSHQQILSHIQEQEEKSYLVLSCTALTQAALVKSVPVDPACN
jgi:Na+-transporting NADH:ubiquinone oxidoreductase subunit NqrF